MRLAVRIFFTNTPFMGEVKNPESDQRGLWQTIQDNLAKSVEVPPEPRKLSEDEKRKYIKDHTFPDAVAVPPARANRKNWGDD